MRRMKLNEVRSFDQEYIVSVRVNGCALVPKANLRLDLLDGPTEFRKAVIFMVTVYYSRRIQIKISKRKRYTGERCQNKPGPSFWLSS